MPKTSGLLCRLNTKGHEEHGTGHFLMSKFVLFSRQRSSVMTKKKMTKPSSSVHQVLLISHWSCLTKKVI